MAFPWNPGSATAVGSYPGDDFAEALRVVSGELPELPHLPELPARGVGADMIGRTAGMLVDLPVRVEPSGWRLGDRPGRDNRRADDHLKRDLAFLEELLGGHDGPFKIQVCGPWTLAAAIELPNGQRVLRDPGAVRDLIASLREGVAKHVEDVRRAVPHAEILLQLDEPGLPAVLAGRVPTASGLSRLRAVEAPLAEQGIRDVFEGVDDVFPLVHCCAADVPYGLLRGAGAKGISVDMRLVPKRDDDAVGETIDAGVALFLGVVPGTDAPLPSLEKTAAPVRELWRRLGFSAGQRGEQVVVTPSCGLAGASPRYARAALAHCQETARMLHESDE
ncbi:methionine synthase [Actinomadura gamaensis]|uniref:Methionine synthase n=1 Tax=Actinomadura gamaensis TaxID=1763541 RepID=A0ABV9TTN5_9ACTN